MKQRVISLILSVCMILTLFPTFSIASYATDSVTLLVSSSAEDDNSARAENAIYKTIGGALAKAEAGDTIQLATDITENVVVESDKAVTLDLNGNTLTAGSELTTYGAISVAMAIENNGILAITDSCGTPGEIISTDGYGIVNKEDAELYIDCVSMEADKAVVNDGYTVIVGGQFDGDVSADSITGGKFSDDPKDDVPITHLVDEINEAPYFFEVIPATAKDGTKSYHSVQDAIDANVDKSNVVITMLKNSSENIVIPSGASLTLDLDGNNLVAASTTGCAITNNGVLTLTSAENGKVMGGARGVEQNGTLVLGGKVNITQNTENLYLPAGKTVSALTDFEGTVSVTTEIVPAENAPVFITEGDSVENLSYFKSDSTGEVLVAFDGNDTVVALGVAVAKIGSVKYASLETALDEAKAGATAAKGDTITLLKDVTLAKELNVNKALVIEGKGFTVSGSIKLSDDAILQNMTVSGPADGTAILFNGIDDGVLYNVNVSDAEIGVQILGGGAHFAGNIDLSGNTLCGIKLTDGGELNLVEARLSFSNETASTPVLMNVATKGTISFNPEQTILGSAKDANTDYYYIGSKIAGYEARILEEKYDTLANAVEAAKAGDTVIVLDNILLTQALTIDKAITIDGKGFSITRSASGGAALVVTAPAIIKNLTVTGPNTTNPGWDEGEFAIIVDQASGARLENITVKNSNAGIQVNGGSVVMTGTVELSGNECGGIELCNGAALNISEANLVNTGESEYAPTLWEESGKGSFTPGTKIPYKKVVNSERDNFYINVLNTSAEATINNVIYSTVDDALAAAQPGATIDLVRSINVSHEIVIDKAITLNGHDFTIARSSIEGSNPKAAIVVSADATIKNVNIIGPNTTPGAINQGEYAIKFIQTGTARLIDSIVRDADMAILVEGGSLVMSGTIDISGNENGAIHVCKNGTVLNLSAASLKNDSECSEAPTIINDGTTNGKGTIVQNGAQGLSIKTVVAGDNGKNFYYINSANSAAQARIGTTLYATLASAIGAAAENETVTLVEDITLEYQLNINKAITLDGDGHTITRTTTGAIGSTFGTAIQVVADATIKNLKISGPNDSAEWDNEEFAIKFINTTDAAISNLTVLAANAGILVSGGALSMSGTIDLSGTEFGGIELCGGGTLNLTGATLVNSTETGESPVLWCDNGKGTFTADPSQNLYIITIDSGRDNYYLDPALAGSQARIGSKLYATIDAAMAEVETSGTVVLTRDIEINEQLVIGKIFTLDGDGHTITRIPSGGGIETKSGIKVTTAATISNLTVSGPNSTMAVFDDGEFAISFCGASVAAISNVSVKNANGGILVSGSSVTMTGIIDVSGNEFGGIELCQSGVLDLSGATLVNTDETNSVPTLWNNNTKGAIIFNPGQMLYKQLIDPARDNYYVSGKNAGYAARIGNETYATLADALAAAPTSGAIINLADNIELTENITIEADRTVTIDLNGFVISTTTVGSVIVNNGTLTIQDSLPSNPHTEADLSGVHGGIITGGSAVNGGGICNNGTLTLIGGTIMGNKAAALGGGIYQNGTMTIGGTASVMDNTVNGNANNLYLPAGRTIAVQDDLSGKVAVSTQNAPSRQNSYTTSGSVPIGSATKDLTTCFTSDRGSCNFLFNSNYIYLFDNTNWDISEYMYFYQGYYGVVDVQGRLNGSSIQTTYGNQGYNEATDGDWNGVTRVRTVKLVDNGNTVQFSYTITNTSNVAKTLAFALHTDVQIGYNDGAAVHLTENGQKITMIQDSSYSSFYGQKYTITSDSSSPFSGTWIGHWSTRYSYLFSHDNSIVNGFTTPGYPYYNRYTGNPTDGWTFSGVDSGISFHWDMVLEPGQTTVKTCYFQIAPAFVITDIDLTANAEDKVVTFDVDFDDEENRTQTLYYTLEGSSQKTAFAKTGYGQTSGTFKFDEKVTNWESNTLRRIDLYGTDSAGYKSRTYTFYVWWPEYNPDAPDYHTLAFKNTGKGFASIRDEAGTTVTLPIDEASGKTFSGWNTERDGSGIEYKGGESYTMTSEDLVLYAQWKISADALTIGAENQQYTSYPIETVTVAFGMEKLIAGVDYDIVYENNTNVGTATATISGKSIDGSRKVSFTITQRSVTLEWTAPEFLEYNKKAKVPTVKVSGLLGADTGSVSIALNSGSNINAGNFTYIASNLRINGRLIDVENSNYRLGVTTADYTSPVYTITPKTVSLAWTAPTVSMVYDGTAKVPSVAVGQLISGDDCTAYTAVNSGSNTNAGSYTYRATALSNPNYKLPNDTISDTYTITPREAVLSWTTPASLVYDKTSKIPTAAVSNAVSGDSFNITRVVNSGDAVNVTDAGFSYKVTGLGNSNYSLPADVVGPTYKIAPKTVELSWTSPAALTYDKTAKVPTVSASNLISGDSCNVSAVLTAGKDNVNVGKFTYTATTLSSVNYQLSTDQAKLTSPEYAITPKTVALVWTTPAALVYDKTAKVPGVAASGLENGDSCVVNAALTSGKDNVNVGEFTFTAESLGNSNYQLPENTVSSEYTITQKEVGLFWSTLSADELVYDGKVNVLTAAALYLEDGDVCDVNVAVSEGEDNIHVGTFTFAANSLSNGNYKLPVNVTSGAFTITAKPITAMWTDTNQVYTGTALKPMAGLIGVCTGDTVNVVGIEATAAGSHQLVGSLDNPDYSLTNPSVNFVIEKSAVAFTVTNSTVPEDGNSKKATIINDKGLVENTDYTVTYVDSHGETVDTPTEPGDYSIYVTLVGNNYRHTTGADGGTRKIGILTIYSGNAPATYKITFSGNENTSGSTADITGIKGGDSVIMPGCGFTKTDYIFVGWKYNNAICKAGESFTMPSADVEFSAEWTQKTYVIGGIVINSGDAPQKDAVVTLMSGARQVSQTSTDAEGKFTFSDVLPGLYNLVVSYDGIIVTTAVELVDADIHNLVVKLPVGRTNSIVEILAGSPEIIVSGLEKSFEDTIGNYTEEDEMVVTSGGSVELKITISETVTTTPEQKEELAKKSSNDFLLLNIDLSKTVLDKYGVKDNAKSGTLYSSDDLLMITIPIPVNMQGKSSYQVFRYHKNSASEPEELTEMKQLNLAEGELPTEEGFTVNAERTTITIYADSFSLYAITYKNSIPSGHVISGDKTENGKLTISTSKAGEKQTVKITVTPDEGYVLDELIVKDTDGNIITLTKTGDNEYSFTMPGTNVTISASFIKADVCQQDENCVYAKYTDADTKAWYHDGVHFCVERGYMVGLSADKFAPNGTLTRAQIVTMLWNKEGKPFVNYAMSFEDVAEDKWYAESIRWAQSTGVVKGFSDQVFGPDVSVTREQLVTILMNYAKFKKYDVSAGEDTNILSYDDAIGGISEWAIPSMQWAVGSGIIAGIDNRLDARENATRAQLAQIIMHFVKIFEEK